MTKSVDRTRITTGANIPVRALAAPFDAAIAKPFEVDEKSRTKPAREIHAPSKSHPNSIHSVSFCRTTAAAAVLPSSPPIPTSSPPQQISESQQTHIRTGQVIRVCQC